MVEKFLDENLWGKSFENDLEEKDEARWFNCFGNNSCHINFVEWIMINEFAKTCLYVYMIELSLCLTLSVLSW